jgi:hypothetical protein
MIKYKATNEKQKLDSFFNDLKNKRIKHEKSYVKLFWQFIILETRNLDFPQTKWKNLRKKLRKTNLRVFLWQGKHIWSSNHLLSGGRDFLKYYKKINTFLLWFQKWMDPYFESSLRNHRIWSTERIQKFLYLENNSKKYLTWFLCNNKIN